MNHTVDLPVPLLFSFSKVSYSHLKVEFQSHVPCGIDFVVLVAVTHNSTNHSVGPVAPWMLSSTR